MKATKTVLAWHFLTAPGELSYGDPRPVVVGETLEHLNADAAAYAAGKARAQARAWQEAARQFLDGLGVAGAAGGYVHFWRGKPCGWSASDRLHAHPEYYRQGVVAVPLDSSSPILRAMGGDEDAGAETWEAFS